MATKTVAEYIPHGFLNIEEKNGGFSHESTGKE